MQDVLNLSKRVISIHAPAKGATAMGVMPLLEYRIFQSTLPRRERPHILYHLPMSHPISIHAPAKGATPCFFNRHITFTFQSTLPRRERLPYYDGVYPQFHFNPRSREGSDIARHQHGFRFTLFQSTLPRRERRSYYYKTETVNGFQSTLPRRERHQ